MPSAAEHEIDVVEQIEPAYADEKRRAYEQGARLFSTYSQKKHPFLLLLVERALAWARASQVSGTGA